MSVHEVADMNLTDQVSKYEIDRHENKGQI